MMNTKLATESRRRIRNSKAGQSGNPKGRKKNSRNLKDRLTTILQKRISVREGDRKFKVSGRKAC